MNPANPSASIRALLEVSDDLLFVMDLTSRQIIDISSSIEKLAGYARDDVKSWAQEEIEQLIHPVDQSRFRNFINDISNARHHKVHTETFLIRDAGNKWIAVAIQLKVIETTREGVPHLAIGSARNVSWQHQQEKLFKAVFSNAFNGFIVFSAIRDSAGTISDFEFEMVNPRAEQIMGMSEAELLGRTMLQVFPGVKADGLFEQYVAVLESGKLMNQEVMYNHEQFDSQWFHLCITRMEDYLLFSYENVTNRKQAELELLNSCDQMERRQKELEIANTSLEETLTRRHRELKQKNQELQKVNEIMDSFVHIVAHDLRAPIANLKAGFSLINRTTNTEKKLDILSHIGHSMERLDHTIDGLMEIVEMQSSSAIATTLRFEEVLQKICAELQERMCSSRARVCTDFEQVPSIHYAEVFLQSILRNLLTNAIKYAAEERPPLVEVSTRKAEEYVVLTIRDNGIGMDLQKIGNTLFQPFKRFTNQAEGVGVGLYIIKNIIERNGGHLHISSSPQQGTTVECYLKEYVEAAG